MALVTDKPVCVTGASGYIASHIVAQLLERGYHVRGTVRKTAADYPFLTELPGADERLELVTASLLDEGSYDPAVAGCDYVMHTASPYQVTVADPQRDLVDPALQGTRNVLGSCAKAGVRRVVLTSSMAAVTDEPETGHVYTEDDWNEKSGLDRNPYYYSKVVAEKAAWGIAEAEDTPFDLVVINPFLVIGPSLTPSLNESPKVLVDLLAGQFPALVAITWGVVDVRDVAASHILAMETQAAQGRYVCAAETVDLRTMVGKLREFTDGGAGFKLPKMSLEGGFGTAMVKALSIFQPKGVRQYLRTHLGRGLAFDNSKIKNDLGLEFLSIDQSVRETLSDLERWGHIKARKQAA